MALDIVARTQATSAAASASQALAAASPAGTFTTIGSRTIDPSVTVIASSGYATTGRGIGTYVADSLATAALAAAHPRFCKATSNGRYFRLIPPDTGNAINVAQGGATGTPGTNDQPAIQATVAYACAVGIKWVEFPDAAYDLWCPLRTTDINTPAVDGHPIAVTTTTALGLRGLPGSTVLNLKNSNGGSKNTITQTVSSTPWQGGGIFVLPGGTWPAGSMDTITIENLIIDGGVTYTPGNLANTNVWDKGLWIQDITVNHVILRDTTLKNFAGEIYYVGGGGTTQSQYLENVVLDGSPQSALNPSKAGGTFVAVNLLAGNSYQPAEVLGGQSFTLIGGRLYDGSSSYLTGGPDHFDGAYFYSWPFRDTTQRPPWCRIIGTAFDNVASGITFGSYVQLVDPVFTDTPVFLNNTNQKQTDVVGCIFSYCDKSTGFAALSLQGPPTLTTQAASCPAGVYQVPPKNLAVEVVCKRTQNAAANAYVMDAIQIYPGLLDASCQFTVSGEARYAWQYMGTPVAGFVQPLITAGQFAAIPEAQKYAGAYDVLDVNKSYKVQWSAMRLLNSGTTARTIALDMTYGYVHGQKVRFFKDEAGGNTATFSATGTGMLLDRDYVLTNQGDYLDLVYDSSVAKWIVDGFGSTRQTTFYGTATYDAPNLTTGSATTTTVTVTGAALGDFVQVTFGLDLLGMTATGYVSAANTVTVVLHNPTGGAINLASTTVTVRVTKR